MKHTFRSLLLLILIIGCLPSCKEESLNLFGAEHHIYFDKFYKDAVFPGKEKADSTEVSFFFLPDDQKTLDAAIVVNMTGRLLVEDMPFSLKVVKEETTAVQSEYEIAPSYTFRANNVSPEARNQSDTIHIKMFKSDRLASMPKGVALVVELVPQGDLKLGQTERRRAKIILTNDAVRPDWWDKNVEFYLFGQYSSRKYKLFLVHIPGARELDENMIKERPDRVRTLLTRYKKWLNENPTLAVEEDGSPITLEI